MYRYFFTAAPQFIEVYTKSNEVELAVRVWLPVAGTGF